MKKYIMLFLIALITSCGDSKSGHRHGDTVVISEKCIVAVDEDSYKEMVKYCVRKDEVGLELMEARGLIKILEKGESGVITEMGFDKIKIRMIDNNEYWCANKYVK